MKDKTEELLHDILKEGIAVVKEKSPELWIATYLRTKLSIILDILCQLVFCILCAFTSKWLFHHTDIYFDDDLFWEGIMYIGSVLSGVVSIGFLFAVLYSIISLYTIECSVVKRFIEMFRKEGGTI